MKITFNIRLSFASYNGSNEKFIVEQIRMSKLTKIKEQAEALSNLLTNVIRSESRETQIEALSAYEDFDVTSKKNSLHSLMLENGPTGLKIKLAQRTIPDLISTIEGKVKTLREVLGVSESHEDNYFEDSLSSVESIEELPEIPLVTNSGKVEEIIEIKEDIEHSKEDSLLEVLKSTFKPYLSSLEERDGEYSYGVVEYCGSFFGASGYSKTDKTDAIQHLYDAIENSDSSRLSVKDKAVLKQGTLGTYLNKVLDLDGVGSELDDLLEAGSSSDLTRSM